MIEKSLVVKGDPKDLDGDGLDTEDDREEPDSEVEPGDLGGDGLGMKG